MKTSTVKGKTVVELTINRGRGNNKTTIYVARKGKRVFFTEDVSNVVDNWNDPTYEANLYGGVKTIQRLFIAALDGNKIKGARVQAYYENYRDSHDSELDCAYGSFLSLRLDKHTRRLHFIAPCGASGWMTAREAQKLVDALETL